MPIRDIELVGIEFTLGLESGILFQREDDLESLKTVLDVELRVAAATPSEHNYLIDKERIGVESKHNVLKITQAYPPTDLDRFMTAVGEVVKNVISPERPWVYAVTVYVIVQHDFDVAATEYIGSRMLQPHTGLSIEEWKLVGGSVRMVFERETETWIINLDPRFEQLEEPRLFGKIGWTNVTPLTEQLVRTAIDLMWNKTQIFLYEFDGRGPRQ